MEVLSEEESQQVIASMTSPFIKDSSGKASDSRSSSPSQQVLLIHGAGQPYTWTPDHKIPEPTSDEEVLIRVIAIGLNPVDWKGPDYNFGLPSLPWINGRDFAGVVVRASQSLRRIRVGDVVLGPSTDYRDVRKAAFQEFVISTEFNCARIPQNMPVQNCAAIGVAFVAATLALGICLGIDFSAIADSTIRGPNLLALLRIFVPSCFPEDIRHECMEGISLPEKARPSDWIAIWGGRSVTVFSDHLLTSPASTATGFTALQLAKLVGLRTICVADVAKHGERLADAGADVLVDRLDTDRAVAVIRGVTRGRLRFGFDTVGKSTAEILQSTLGTDPANKSHLVGLTGLPKASSSEIIHHSVPIKAFHSFPNIGEALMSFLESLLLNQKIITPQVEIAQGGLQGVNDALNSLKGGKFGGKRIVVPVQPIPATA